MRQGANYTIIIRRKVKALIGKTHTAWRGITARSVYFQYFAGLFLTALLSILIMGLTSYFFSSSGLVEQTSQQRTNALIQTKNTADIALKEIEKLFIGKTVDPVFNQLIPKEDPARYEMFNKIARILVECRNANENICSVYYYIPYLDYVITSEDGRWDIKRFYDTGWMEAYAQRKGSQWLPTRSIHTYIGESPRVFSLLMPVQMEDSMDGEETLIIVNIKEERFLSLIQENVFSQFDSTLIIDEDGRQISNPYATGRFREPDFIGQINSITDHASGYFSRDMGGERYLLSYAGSEYNKWKYIRLTPEREVTRPASYIKIIIAVAAGLCILLGFAAAFMTTKKIYKPISDFVNFAKNHDSGTEKISENEIVYLNKEFGKIIAQNKDLNTTLQKNEQLIREKFIHDLLMNEMGADEDPVLKSKLCGCAFCYPAYRVMLVSMDKLGLFSRTRNEKEKGFIFENIKRIIDESVVGKEVYGISVQLESGKYAAVLNTPGDGDGILQISEQIRASIKNLLNVTVTVGISKNTLELAEVHNAYTESLEAVKKRVVLGGDRVVVFDGILSGNLERFLISTVNSKHLNNYIRGNNVEEVIKILERLIDTVRNDPNYPAEDMINLLYSVLVQTVKTVIEKGWSLSDIFGARCELYRELIDNENIYDMGAWLYASLRKMSHFMMDKKENKNQAAIQSILAYMKENYRDDITLNFMAESVYLSPSYLSKIFKEATGKNYLEYLTEIRIEASKQLLKQSNYKITEINERVNLGNVQNFIRIFKRHEGITPGQYREKLIKSNLRDDETEEDVCDV